MVKIENQTFHPKTLCTKMSKDKKKGGKQKRPPVPVEERRYTTVVVREGFRRMLGNRIDRREEEL